MRKYTWLMNCLRSSALLSPYKAARSKSLGMSRIPTFWSHWLCSAVFIADGSEETLQGHKSLACKPVPVKLASAWTSSFRKMQPGTLEECISHAPKSLLKDWQVRKLFGVHPDKLLSLQESISALLINLSKAAHSLKSSRKMSLDKFCRACDGPVVPLPETSYGLLKG